MAAVWTTPLDGELPVELFFRLPEWCVYVETPGQIFLDATPLHGFYAHLEENQNATGHYELRILLDTDTALMGVPIHLEYGSTIESGLAAARNEAIANLAKSGLPSDFPIPDFPEGFPELLASLVSLVLYLCSDKPEIASDGIVSRQNKPSPRKTKAGWRIFPPDKPRIWDVGAVLGAALRRAYERERIDLGGTHASPRAHIRRAHWHSF